MSSAPKKRPRRGKILPTPRNSAWLYVSIEPSRVGMFRFLLEASDNLALMSVVDRFGAVLQIRFSPHQEREVREFLNGMRERLPFDEILLEDPLKPFAGGATLPPSRQGSASFAPNRKATQGGPLPHKEFEAKPPTHNGTLVYVMGPSGCGKDSLLREAAQALERLTNEVALEQSGAVPGRVYFVRRHITRPAEAGGEEHIAVSDSDFAAKRAAGFFALDWESHGLRYGIAASDINACLAEGLTVVLNGSRAYLPEALRRYPALIPVLITVRPEILRDRLLARGRETQAEIEARLSRIIPEREEPAGLIRLDNSGNLADAVAIFTDLLQRLSRSPDR